MRNGDGRMNDDDQALLYEAGYLAGRLQWPNPYVVSGAELSAMAPVGDPVIVVCGDEGLTINQARAVKAVNEGSRPIRVVTARTLPAEVAAWLPQGSVHVIGQDVATPPATAVNRGQPDGARVATWSDIYHWCTSNASFAVEGDSSGSGLGVRAHWANGRAQNAVVLHMVLGGVDCVSIRSMFLPVEGIDLSTYFLALRQVSLDPNSPWAAPYGFALESDNYPVLGLKTALPLAGLTRSQFEFALVQVLGTSDAVEQTLGIDLNR